MSTNQWLSYEELKRRLNMAESSLQAIRRGQIDTIVGEQENLVVRLEGAEKREAHIKQVLLAIRNVNQLIMHESDPRHLIEGACANLTATLGYSNAWIALLHDNYTVGVTASSGFNGGFDRLQAQLKMGDFPDCVKRALVSDEVVIIKDPPNECSNCPLAGEYAGRMGLIRALTFEKRSYGVLAVSVPSAFAYDTEAQTLFNELAHDLGFALQKIADKKALQFANDIINRSPAVAFVWKNAQGWPVEYASQNTEKIFGWSAEDFMSNKISYLSVIHPDDLDRVSQEVAQSSADPNATSVEHLPYRIISRNGDIRWVEDMTFIQRTDEGEIDAYKGILLDISSRKQAEKTLKESEHKYRLLVENANETIMLVQAAQIVFINRQGEALFEFSQSELSSRPLGDFIHEEDRDMVLARHQRRLKGESLPDRYSFRIVSKSGQIKWVELKVAVVSWEGEPATLCFLSDITARREAEIALRESERKFRDLFNSISDTVFIHDMQGRFVEVNEVACRIYGYSREEIRRMTPRDLDAPEDRRLFSERVQTLDEEGRLVFDAVHRRKDGSKFPVEIHSRKIEYQGHPCILSIVRDITRRKQTEQTLRKRTRDLQERVKELNCLYGISNLVATPDISLDQIIQGVVELIPRSWRYPDVACARIVLEGKEYRTKNFEETQWRQTGDIQVHGKSSGILEVCYIEEKPGADEGPFFKEERSLVAAVSERLGRIIERDRSKKEKHMLENRLQQARKMEAIGTLAGGIAHEFNNALTAIMGNIELLKMDLAEGDHRGKYFRAMEQSGLRLSGLTNQLLAYARGGKYQATNLKLPEFVLQTLPLLQYNLKPGIQVKTHFAKHTAYVRADHTQMQMMLSAILANANEAIDEEGLIKISADNQEVEEASADRHPGLDPGLYVCLSIEDDGTGMDEETRKGIFEPFFTTKFQGRGMGMAAVYGIVKNHDGWISVDSEANKGTVVRIFLPALETGENTAKKIKTPPDKGTGTILLIEDEDMVMDAVRAMLERAGYRVLVSKTGRAAVHTAESYDGPIDLALLDIKLPDMEGRGVYPLLLKARPDLKVIVASGYSLDGPAQDILNAGAQGFIQKPFSFTQLMEKLKGVLGQG